MYSRKIRLLRALLGNETMSSGELMEVLEISQRTLRTEIKELNRLLSKESVFIHSLKMGGYYVQKEDYETIQRCLDEMIGQSKQAVFPGTPRERLLFGFTWLFFRHGPVSIQRAAESLYVSNTAMLQTKRQIQDILEWYPGLCLKTGKRGMWLCGSEETKRHVLAQFINYSTYGAIMVERILTFLFQAEKYGHYMTLYRRLPEILAAYGYRLVDKSMEGFALDIFICLMRNEMGFPLAEKKSIRGTPCVEAVCTLLGELGYTVPDEDRAYLEDCLNTKRIFYTPGMQYEVPEECTAVTEEFLSGLDQAYHTEYHKNQALSQKMAVHIWKMVKRIQNGFFDTNTILDDVMERYGREMEMAGAINPILQKRYHLAANVHELSYIAVYLRAYSSRKLTAIVLCDHGEAIADNMVRQIVNYCGEKIQMQGTMSLAEYRLHPLPVDLLISGSRIYNVKVPKKTKIMYVSYLLKEEDLKKIQGFVLKQKKSNNENGKEM